MNYSGKDSLHSLAKQEGKKSCRIFIKICWIGVGPLSFERSYAAVKFQVALILSCQTIVDKATTHSLVYESKAVRRALLKSINYPQQSWTYRTWIWEKRRFITKVNSRIINSWQRTKQFSCIQKEMWCLRPTDWGKNATNGKHSSKIPTSALFQFKSSNFLTIQMHKTVWQTLNVAYCKQRHEDLLILQKKKNQNRV